ncbi:hypothetical protein CVT24_009605 [Panaeolus cyanescens]|uniref:Uncharacterized protein n=1 Tax=Panaeolus cyanescens TaxID=181874 RepID=A0A409YA21_9AGAR|nr:hypothetical protein CVT24_009605 [Panaeolus cyanescens]
MQNHHRNFGIAAEENPVKPKRQKLHDYKSFYGPTVNRDSEPTQGLVRPNQRNQQHGNVVAAGGNDGFVGNELAGPSFNLDHHYHNMDMAQAFWDRDNAFDFPSSDAENDFGLDLVPEPEDGTNTVRIQHDPPAQPILVPPVQQQPANPLPQPVADTEWHPVFVIDVITPGAEVEAEDLPTLGNAPAFGEQACIRIAYLNAVLGNVYANMSVVQATTVLVGTLDALEAGGILPDHPKPVRTLQSAKRRLGLDADQFITKYVVCPSCWKHYTPHQVSELESPSCTVEDCSGVIYTTSTHSNGRVTQIKRVPFKVVPATSIIQTLRRFFLRPGFAKSLRDNRQHIPNQNDDENFVMHDIYDGRCWTRSATHLQRQIGNKGNVRDVPAPSNEDGIQQEPTELNSHRYGLHLTLNTDWFGLLEGRPHSTGPVFLSINNLPRDQRFLQMNVICPCIMPGPGEPDARQLNHCLEPLTKEFIQLNHGVSMNVHDSDDPVEVYADCIFDNCDTPAARKVLGTAGHSADMHPCPYCNIRITDVNLPAGYDWKNLNKKKDEALLRYAFESQRFGEAQQAAILRDFGIRWSVLNLMPNWRPSQRTALDFMHNMFLGVVAHFYTKVLFAAHMFSGIGGNDSAKKRFESCINAIQWPSHVTRLPKNLGENQSLKKADEWRRIIAITPFLLWVSWRNEWDDKIPNSAPPVTAREKITTEHSRNRLQLYQLALLLCVSIRLFATRTISMSQAHMAQEYLANYSRTCLLLKIPLVINHHLSMHYYDMIREYGPVYGYWLFAFERFNGILENVNHNGHDGGEMETTLLRNWIQNQLAYELLISLPPDAHPKERELINCIVETEAKKRGSMMTQIAIFNSEVDNASIKLPKRLGKKAIDLHAINDNGKIYQLLLTHCQSVWPQLNLVAEFSNQQGACFVSDNVARRIPYLRKDGIRYGAQSNARTSADSYAFITVPADGTRKAVQIMDLFVVSIPTSGLKPIVCAIVRRLKSDHNIPLMPWDMHAPVLGIQTSWADEFHEPEAISAAAICAPLALIKVHSACVGPDLSIAVSFDHESAEPDDIDFYEL